ncbi:MAG: DUF4376 domain-containing protein [Chloroflexia bacterium]|nr:DUF4376 domain-containing protein [Chloroflexia bacterium]
MLFYDTRLAQSFTESGLRQRGLQLTRDALSTAGIYPLECAPPDHDQALFTAAPTIIVNAGAELYRQEFELTPRSIEEARTGLKARAGSKRWDVETGGVEIPGFGRIPTGLEDQNRVATSIQGMERAGLIEVDYKLPGGWARLTLDELVEVGKTITTHVEACFARERQLHADIDAAGSIEELGLIDVGSGWPV